MLGVMADQVLWKNKWLEVRERNGWFTFAHLPSDGVAVLGYRTNGKTNLRDFQFLIRHEPNPTHTDTFIATSLTGTIDPGYNELGTAKKELLEESGYSAEESEFRYHGWVYPFKISDFKLHLYSVKLDDKVPQAIVGDGTLGEKGAYVTWSNIDAVCNLSEPAQQAILCKLMFEKNSLLQSGRPSFQEIYMNQALDLARRSTCLRKKVGCVIVSDDFAHVYGLGYNGNAKDFPNTCDSDVAGDCGCLHAEDNALDKVVVPKEVPKIVFVTVSPCRYCAKRFINKGGVKKVYYYEEYRKRDGLEILEKAGIEFEKLT